MGSVLGYCGGDVYVYQFNWTKGYIMADLSVTAGSVVASTNASKVHGTAGATITAGQAVYYDSSAGSWKLAQADGTTAEAGLNGVGIALVGASSGQPVIVATGDSNFDPGATATEGIIYCVSATAGGIAPLADLTNVTPDKVTVLGVGLSTGNIKLAPIYTGSEVQ